MSNQPKYPRQEEEPKKFAGHLNQIDDDDEDNWNDVKPKAQPNDDDDDDYEDEEVVNEEKNEETFSSAESLNEDEVFAQIQQMQNNLPSMIAVLQKKLGTIGEQRKKLDEEEKSVKSRINFVLVLNGQSPLNDDDEDEEKSVPRRQRKKKASSTTTEEMDTEDRPGKKRFKNAMTIKEAICKALLTMTHPSKNDKPYTGFVKDIATKITLPVEKGGLGYKSVSDPFTNTVRIQLYRLVEDDKVIVNDDGSYSLRKRVVRELQGE